MNMFLDKLNGLQHIEIATGMSTQDGWAGIIRSETPDGGSANLHTCAWTFSSLKEAAYATLFLAGGRGPENKTLKELQINIDFPKDHKNEFRDILSTITRRKLTKLNSACTIYSAEVFFAALQHLNICGASENITLTNHTLARNFNLSGLETMILAFNNHIQHLLSKWDMASSAGDLFPRMLTMLHLIYCPDVKVNALTRFLYKLNAFTSLQDFAIHVKLSRTTTSSLLISSLACHPALSRLVMDLSYQGDLERQPSYVAMLSVAQFGAWIGQLLRLRLLELAFHESLFQHICDST